MYAGTTIGRQQQYTLSDTDSFLDRPRLTNRPLHPTSNLSIWPLYLDALCEKYRSMKYRKGEVVKEIQAQHVIPLYTDDVDWKGLNLPQFAFDDHFHHRRGKHRHPKNRGRHDDDATSAFVRKLLSSKSLSMKRGVIVSCIHLVTQADHGEWVGGGSSASSSPRDPPVDARRCSADTTENEDEDDDTDNDISSFELRSSWTVVKNFLSFEKWKKLFRAVASHIVVVECPHPLHEYATHRLPNLPESDRRVAIPTLLNFLNGESPSSTQSTSILSVMKLCQDRFNMPRRYGVLRQRQDNLESLFPHSCIPTAWLDLGARTPRDSPSSIHVSALFDVPDDQPVTVCYVNGDDDVEVREADVRLRTGSSCGCLRCRYEADSRISLDSQQQCTLAHFYLSKGQLETAKELYQASLDGEPDQPDAWHALGAIQLSQGRFMEAQRVWKKGMDRFPASCRMHKGLMLQLEKAQMYRYFDPPLFDDTCTAVHAPPRATRVPVPSVQVTQMLSQSTCQRILEWATTQGEWTQQRHYAVPTNDVPVHTIEPLLEWFNRWFFSEMRPHLAQQFGSSPNYFVHDAFCVKYVAGKTSNHLPIHTDESSHSFVIALNDCDEYEGGGTYFPQTDVVVRLKVGEVLSFRGDSIQHGGEAVTKNARYILVAFLYHDDDDDGPKQSEMNRKRRQNISDLTHQLNCAKEQKTEFSFGFAL